MTKQNPTDFRSDEDWLADVRCRVALSERPYVLAQGRTELFRSFYRMQGLAFPAQYAEELDRIESLCEPDRSASLDALNAAIFESLIAHLRGCARSIPQNDGAPVASPQEEIDDLRGYLAEKNPYFALWLAYQADVAAGSIVSGWEEYLKEKLRSERADEISFARTMADLDKLLTIFRFRNRALPNLLFERILFLHLLRGPDRMVQTRVVLGTLTAELASCTSA